MTAGDPPAGTAAKGLFLVAADLAGSAAAVALATEGEPVVLDRADLHPSLPFAGRLSEVLGAAGERMFSGPGDAAAAADPAAPRATASVRLLVPAVWLGASPAPDLFSVADHVNLRLRGVLTGRWPAGTPRTFPDLSAVYEREPALRRLPPGARVYSGLTVAGVGDARSLTPFERRTIDRLSLQAASDCLVDAVILAAHRRLRVAAWCVPLTG